MWGWAGDPQPSWGAFQPTLGEPLKGSGAGGVLEEIKSVFGLESAFGGRICACG